MPVLFLLSVSVKAAATASPLFKARCAPSTKLILSSVSALRNSMRALVLKLSCTKPTPALTAVKSPLLLPLALPEANGTLVLIGLTAPLTMLPLDVFCVPTIVCERSKPKSACKCSFTCHFCANPALA